MEGALRDAPVVRHPLATSVGPGGPDGKLEPPWKMPIMTPSCNMVDPAEAFASTALESTGLTMVSKRQGFGNPTTSMCRGASHRGSEDEPRPGASSPREFMRTSGRDESEGATNMGGCGIDSMPLPIEIGGIPGIVSAGIGVANEEAEMHGGACNATPELLCWE